MVPHRVKAGLFERSSILFRPRAPETPGVLVESPGTAPGSEPSITGAFITIVRVAPNIPNIGGLMAGHKTVSARDRLMRCASFGRADRQVGGGPWRSYGAHDLRRLGRVGLAGGLRRKKSARPNDLAGRDGVRSDQNPDLISSNSEIIFSRNSAVVGVCMNKVPSTGSR